MKFRIGDDVEVMRNSFWFPAHIVSLSPRGYIVKYSFHLDPTVEERMSLGDVIRPVPPRDDGKRWVAGEVAEVFDGYRWRGGKISKVLKNNMYVIKLFNSILLKQFHESDIRIPKIWRNGDWSETREVAENKLTRISIQPKPDDSRPRRSSKQRRSNPNSQLLGTRCIYLFEGRLIGGSVKKRKSRPCAKGRDKMSGTTAGMLNAFTDDNDQCSVASCSSNKFSGEKTTSSFERISDSSDAESSIPCRNSSSCRLQADVRRFELHAYKSTMLALYASGPLSWEQESLLTNLRLSLHISDDEHLLHLKRLMSAQVL